MEAALRRLTTHVPLSGLNSADFLVGDGTFHLLEINPRPGATLDLFEPDGDSLFTLHVEACHGRLPARVPPLGDAMAGAIIYADPAIASLPAIDWPEWTADRPAPCSRFDRDEPLCSVFARAGTADAAKRLLEERCATVRAMLEGAP
jgi:predicted ATP-grasp superfamily ATP-dependent carboligase